MICPVTGWIFAPKGRHEKCPRCPHCMLCDHKDDKEKSHAHFRDSMQMKGMGSRMFRTAPGVYCHVIFCDCGSHRMLARMEG